MEINLSRRQVLAGLGVGAGVAVYSGGSVSGGGIAFQASNPRDQALRPVMGGTWVSPAEIDKLGTLGVGVEFSGSPAIVTNRHVVDDGSEEEPADVEGRTIYQPGPDAGAIGEVIDASTVGGAGSSDWAVVGVEASSDWSTHTLGFAQLGASVTASAGERIVLDGARTGLLGGEITRTGVDANFRGELYSDLIEYTVDENRDTSGNSGAVVATIDSDGVVHPVGLHTFGFDDYRFAIPWSDLPDGVVVSSGGASPVAPAVGSWVEGAVFGADGGDWWVWLRNLGDQDATVDVELDDPGSGDRLDSASISVGSLSEVALALTPGQDRARLVAGETAIVVDLS